MPAPASMGTIPATGIPATGEVIGAIADIEMQRQVTEKRAGLRASCSSALRRLHEILGREREALRQRGPEAGHPQNVEAVAAEIERVKALAVVKLQGPASQSAHPRQGKESWQDAQRNPGRNKGRRTMGRASGR